tara:strand:- start:735 stop:1850 length:1116 start_codon:yes stop_codon:yes gene_type:complete
VIRKFLQKIFKTISYGIFLKIHGRINKFITSDQDKRIKVKTLEIEENLKYNIYQITDGRLYTDRIQDTAVIIDNNIIKGPSFQLRLDKASKISNSKIENNIVFTKGTPGILRNLKGTTLSLLTGGGGNNNYWHWLFDVLPRLGLCKNYINLEEINYFLLPSLVRKFQKETLDCLNISANKRLSSEKFRHIKTNKLIITDHPVVITGDATNDMQNMPSWIMNWLKNSFIKKNSKNILKNKIYIDRKDTDFANLRVLVNEKEIKKLLLDSGFVFVNLGDIHFSKQVDLFNNAECIVGLHGAGFANLAFCQPETKVIEFRSSDAGPVIENLAKINNLNYYSLISEAKPIHQYGFPNQQGSIEIPINKLKEVLKN